MENKIEHPKVFISYSWSSKEYEEKVMNFAVKLREDGIDVVIDKWDMQAGNDTISFMERNVKDPSVNFVLMLLDKKYAEKADNRSGGVGIETQVISKKVYDDVEQSKFIPIVFDREDNEVYIPTYLKSRFYYDLTKDNFEEEYVKLVKQLYGRQIYYKPELGNRPKWVDDNLNSPNSLKVKVLQMQKSVNMFRSLETEIKKSELGEKNINEVPDEEKNETIIKIYNNFLEYRNVLLDIFLDKYAEENFIDEVCDFYENIKNWNKHNNGIKQEIWESFIHETFIYLIAILLKYKQYKLINIVITKSYFYDGNVTNVIDYFYSYNIIQDAKCKLDNSSYYSGMAKLWMENIYEPKITKQEFTQADLIIYNLTILLLEKQQYYWFPVTYVYSKNSIFDSSLKDFSIRLKSKYEINKFRELFGINSIDELKKLFDKMEFFVENRKERARYLSDFSYADLFTDYIKIDEIGLLN